MGGHDQVSESQVDANKVEARLQGPVRNQEDRGSKERASDAYSSYSIDTLITSTTKQVLGNCERLVAASLAGTFLSTFNFYLCTVHTGSFMLCCQPLLYFVFKYCVLVHSEKWVLLV